jgi:DNA-binding transcriptional regulator LsrR (DeoR family)
MLRKYELRLIARVARMYYLEGLKQSEIAARLAISQATVSRLIKQSHEEGIVKIKVSTPQRTYLELEDRLREAYGIGDVVVAHCEEDREAQILEAIGEAAAHYIETTMREGEVIGVPSWSQTILRMVEHLHFVKRASAQRVVQTLGGMGNPLVQEHATHLTTRLAALLDAEPVLLPVPGVASSKEAKIVLVGDTFVRTAMETFRDITLALVGIGAVEPSEMLAKSGNVFTEHELARLRERGAVGDFSLRFFACDGRPIVEPLDDRVIGITRDELAQVPRVVGLAGGDRKVEAIQGALRTRLIGVLVTDCFTAEKLLLAARRSAATAAHDVELTAGPT